jgi:hypothetical protein
MNQAQREFIIKKVEETFKKDVRELKSQIPDEPSLNNYLIAAFLDDSIEFNDMDKLKKKIRERVLRFGSSDKLVDQDTGYWGRNTPEMICKINATDLFVLPEAYTEKHKEYEAIKKDIEAKIKKLEAEKNDQGFNRQHRFAGLY